MSREQRRARLAARHHLTHPADVTDVAGSLVAVHSSDPVTVFLSFWARVPGFEVSDLEELLYEKRSLVRHWGMRRTLWVMDRERVPIVIGSSTAALGDKERRRTVRLIEEGGVADDGDAWLEAVTPRTLQVVRRHGEVLARELTREIPELAEKLVFKNKAGKVMGTTGMSSRTLVQLGIESRVVRARPAGTWVSGQYSWAVMNDWMGGPIDEVPVGKASAQLIGDWLRAYGPATELDIKWWTGWPVRQVRTALADVRAVEVDLGPDGSGFLLPDDLDEEPDPGPWVALLPSLDTTTMGWKERDWYLGEHYPTVFDRNGNAGPTVWLSGRVVGGWAQRRDGEVAYELFEDVGGDAAAAIEARRRQLQEWLGDVTVTPRFRSPHDKMLAP